MRWANLVLPQLLHLTNLENDLALSASLLPFLFVECFVFGSGAIENNNIISITS
jgi:hypothetical protein